MNKRKDRGDKKYRFDPFRKTILPTFIKSGNRKTTITISTPYKKGGIFDELLKEYLEYKPSYTVHLKPFFSRGDSTRIRGRDN